MRKIDTDTKSVAAKFVYFVDADNLSQTQIAQLEDLLNAQYVEADSIGQTIITPRIGTISAWSTKATDIAHNYGLGDVRRIERAVVYDIAPSPSVKHNELLHDRMTESVVHSLDEAEQLFLHTESESHKTVSIKDLSKLNKSMALSLSGSEIEYLKKSYTQLNRDPTDIELMMFSAVNSEHCRHKIFNASWEIDGKPQDKSLFDMIRNTYNKGGQHVLSAYSDNSAALKGFEIEEFNPDNDGVYGYTKQTVDMIAKVETHNHPTAISPSPGAATGVGGEIRDEGATGRGAKPKMGLSGFSVSDLRLSNHPRPWENNLLLPGHIRPALDIMLEAPIGGSAYANEFGRPTLAGYFRSFEVEDDKGIRWGYHKPIMLAGGAGNIRREMIKKNKLKDGSLLIVLGGPSMTIGLGGGTASSVDSGKTSENLDFASVQRGNAEMQRRAQEVITRCWQLGTDNPITSIHDVGAGGISNALPELAHDSGMGATIELRDVPVGEEGMTPLEIWCNEAQERYVIGVDASDLEFFDDICRRERAEYAVVGRATQEQRLIVSDSKFNNKPVDIPMSLLFGEGSEMYRSYNSETIKQSPLNLTAVEFADAVERVLSNPAVASKKFLITIGDRTVGGLTVRDQMVGPWQVPVADVAVTSTGFGTKTGEAMTIGERPPLSLISPTAAVRIAVGETITNIVAAPIDDISKIAISGNWMAAAGNMNEDQHLREAVTAVGEEFCPELGITIPVGKDSLSMRAAWDDDGESRSVTSPVSFIATGFAPVHDVRNVMTPELKRKESELLYIDLGLGNDRLAGSILAQCYNQIGDESPDVSADILKQFFIAVQDLNEQGLIAAYHDRSDGGLFTTLVEMAFAGRCGLDVNLDGLGNALELMFSEELGAVVQVYDQNVEALLSVLPKELANHVHRIGRVDLSTEAITITKNSDVVYRSTRPELEKIWSSTSHEMQRLRDNPSLADAEHRLIDQDNPGLQVSFDYVAEVPPLDQADRPKAAILREQGVNGHVEMAAAFTAAGFESHDVHMTDLLEGGKRLADYSMLVACGGFSYGDVLGAGVGWSKTILGNDGLRRQFAEFFERSDTLSLGVCNGAQMLSGLRSIIPGADKWPEFTRNESEQFEARFVSVEVQDSRSVLFGGMKGAILNVPVAHGEGRVVGGSPSDVALKYVNYSGDPTEDYPMNPNGSADGVTGLTSKDGRATIMMPHPERVILTQQNSWHPEHWKEYGPWIKMFTNAHDWIVERSQ